MTDEDFCKLSISYEDKIIESCGISYKLIRTWQIFNWCLPTSEPTTFDQIIVVEDTVGPEVDVPSEITINANENCGGFIDLSGLSISDDCSEVTGLRAEYYLTNSNNGSQDLFVVDLFAGNPINNLPTGATTAMIIATDACHNSSATEIVIKVVDDKAPTAICNDGLTISLNDNGVARLYAEDFGEGSNDNCSAVSLAVKSNGCMSNEFAEFAEFACCDLGTVVVELLVTDAGGNTNTCWAEITVEDATAPQISCADHITVDCGEASHAESLFIEPEATDNCSVSIEAGEIVQTELPNCGQLLTRTFTATDGSTKTEDPTCTQSITVVHVSDFIVQFPADITINSCPDELVDFEEPIITEDDCENIAISVEDRTFVQTEEACFVIERTYTIINHCIVDNANGGNFTELGTPLPIPRTFRDDDGYFQYTQHISVRDNDAPSVSFTAPDPCDLTDLCQGEVALIAIGEDDCSNAEDLTFSYKIDALSDGNIDMEGDGNDASGIYPYGDHIIKWTISDGCGNTTSEEFDFSVRDCKNPTPICQGINTVVMNNGECVSVRALDLLLYAEDNCTSMTTEEWQQNARVRREGDSSALATIVNLCCDDLEAGNIDVEVWIEDEAGNSDFCIVSLAIQDNGGNCSDIGTGSSARISGSTLTEFDDMVDNVNVAISNSTVQTDQEGVYTSIMAANETYEVKPEKLDEIALGISTLDLVFMAQHILQIRELESPYQLIAADVNDDKVINIFDMLELRQLVLFAISDFSNNTSWRFVDASYVFQNPKAPLNENYPQSIYVDLGTTDVVDEDFIAVKIGDIDGSAKRNVLHGLIERSNAPLVFTLANEDLEKGNLYKVDFKAQGFKSITGYQFTLQFDQLALEFSSVESGVLKVDKGNFGLNKLKEGVLTTSYTEMGNEITAQNNEVLFSIYFRAKGNTKLENAISLSNLYTKAEVYRSNGVNGALQLRFNENMESNEGPSKFELFQNSPNPFSNETKIGFNLPEAGSASILIYDITGKEILRISDQFNRGYNEVILTKDQLKSSGTFYYKFNSVKHTATRKMIILE